MLGLIGGIYKQRSTGSATGFVVAFYVACFILLSTGKPNRVQGERGNGEGKTEIKSNCTQEHSVTLNNPLSEVSGSTNFCPAVQPPTAAMAADGVHHVRRRAGGLRAKEGAGSEPASSSGRHVWDPTRGPWGN